MNFKKTKILCDDCLSEFEFGKSDLQGNVGDDLYELYVTCPLCGNDVEIYDVEEYGIWLPDLDEVGEMEELGYDELE